MSAAIFDNRSMCRAVLKREKEVVLMEDSLAVKEAIKEVIEGEVGWIVKMARNSDEVADLAKNGEAAIYIIDNKIGDNPTEGLTALEKINNINKDIPVAIFSAHPSYKIRAEKINNNLVIYEVKGTSLKENARHIITAFVNRLRQLIDEIQNKIKNSDDEYRNIFIELPEKEKLELERDRQKLELEQLPAKNTSATLSIPTDIDGNFEAYEKCQSDREWLAKYESKYVAFVGGEQVFPKITDEQELLKLIRENYPKQRRLFTKVTKSGKTRVVKAPSGYSKIKKI